MDAQEKNEGPLEAHFVIKMINIIIIMITEWFYRDSSLLRSHTLSTTGLGQKKHMAPLNLLSYAPKWPYALNIIFNQTTAF